MQKRVLGKFVLTKGNKDGKGVQIGASRSIIRRKAPTSFHNRALARFFFFSGFSKNDGNYL